MCGVKVILTANLQQKMSNSNKNITQEMSRNSRHLNAEKIHRSHLNLLIEWDITAMSI